jgi:hypothetical protein
MPHCNEYHENVCESLKVANVKEHYKDLSKERKGEKETQLMITSWRLSIV